MWTDNQTFLAIVEFQFNNVFFLTALHAIAFALLALKQENSPTKAISFEDGLIMALVVPILTGFIMYLFLWHSLVLIATDVSLGKTTSTPVSLMMYAKEMGLNLFLVPYRAGFVFGQWALPIGALLYAAFKVLTHQTKKPIET